MAKKDYATRPGATIEPVVVTKNYDPKPRKLKRPKATKDYAPEPAPLVPMGGSGKGYTAAGAAFRAAAEVSDDAQD